MQAGLIKGGDLDNAIVIYEREMSQEDFDKLADVMEQLMAENIPQQAEQPSKRGKRKIIRVMAKTIDIELQKQLRCV